MIDSILSFWIIFLISGCHIRSKNFLLQSLFYQSVREKNIKQYIFFEMGVVLEEEPNLHVEDF